MSGNSSSRAGRARLGAVGFTVIAVLLALAAAFFLARLLKGRGYDQDAMQNIVVAAQDLSPGTDIREDELVLRLWPAKSIPKGAFKSVKKLMASKHRVPLQMILKGEPVLASRLAEASRGSGMAPLVPKNMRAFPVRVDRWISASKMLYPGAMVDVVTTVKTTDKSLTSKLVIQKVKVVAVNGAVDGASFMRPSDGKKKKKKARRQSLSVVTLLLSPAQVEKMALAMRAGKIDLVLRGASDDNEVDTGGANVVELMGIGAADGSDGDASGADGVRRAGYPAAKSRRRGPVRKRRSSAGRRPAAVGSRSRGSDQAGTQFVGEK